MTRTVNVFSSKGDVAYNELRELILSGELSAGSKVAQYDLADRLGMSITPIREAVRRLLSEGLVEMTAHRDARVAPINSDEARHLFEVRLALDPAAAELAAYRRSDDDLAAITAAAAELLPVTQQWGEDALIAHRRFHRAIYVASHNPMLIHMLDDLWDKSDRYRRLGLALPSGAEPRTVDHRQHHEMVEMISAGEGAELARLTRRHIEQSLTASAIKVLEGGAKPLPS